MYFPDSGEWETREPDAIGIDPDALEAAIAHHQTNATPHEQVNFVHSFPTRRSSDHRKSVV